MAGGNEQEGTNKLALGLIKLMSPFGENLFACGLRAQLITLFMVFSIVGLGIEVLVFGFKGWDEVPIKFWGKNLELILNAWNVS